MDKPHGARTCRRPARPGRAAVAIVALAFVGGLHVGCANDPYSQKRIALRRAYIQQTIQGIAKHESGAVSRLQERIQNFRRWYAEDEVLFRQRMRMAGNNIW